jgi:predicted deacylase
MNLARELRPEMVSGRIIMIPTLNEPATRAATRLSPLDGGNLNRAFPGKADGSSTEQIAYYLTNVLFPMCDVMIDIHSGGRSLTFYPCTCIHLVDDKTQRRKMFEATLAWNADFLMFYLTDIAGSGLLPVEAGRQGKIVVTTEMGGGETIPASTHRVTQGGLRNVLVHCGVLEGKEQTRESLGLAPAKVVQSLTKKDYLLAPESGIFESTADLGSLVASGQPVGQIHFLERPDRPPEVIKAESDGYIICHRAPCLTRQGDVVATIAQPIDQNKIL